MTYIFYDKVRIVLTNSLLVEHLKQLDDLGYRDAQMFCLTLV